MVHEKCFVPTKFTLLTVLLASTLMLLGGAAVAPALPAIAAAFPDAGDMTVDLIVTLPSLAVALSGLFIGALADRIGKVKVLLASLLIFAVAGVSGFFLEDMTLLLVGRFFVGVGIAGITSCCSALITEYYHGDIRLKVLGYQTAAMGLGVLILEVGGGTLAEFGWHEPFLIYSIGFLILLMAVVSMREPTDDVVLSDTPDRVTDRRAIAICYLGIAVAMIVMYALPTKLATYVVQTTDASTTLIGLALGLNGVFNAGVCLMYRRIARAVPRKFLLTVGLGLMAIGMILLSVSGDIVWIIISSCAVGMGVGMCTTTVMNVLSDNVTPASSGKVMGGYTTFFNLGQFISTFVIAAMISLTGDLKGLYLSMGIIAAIAAVVFLPLMLSIKRE